jgi:hypothetical protein
MEFRLIYQGPLPSNGSPAEKHELRRSFHPQLRTLWDQLPLREIKDAGAPLGVTTGPDVSQQTLIHPLGGFRFVPLVNRSLKLIAELNVMLLRPQEPGAILRHAGDIDNRIKTLLDALRMPREAGELPTGAAPQADEDPFHCLLEDDALVTAISISTDRLLTARAPSDVSLVIHVRIKGIQVTWDNIGVIG